MPASEREDWRAGNDDWQPDAEPPTEMTLPRPMQPGERGWLRGSWLKRLGRAGRWPLGLFRRRPSVRQYLLAAHMDAATPRSALHGIAYRSRSR